MPIVTGETLLSYLSSFWQEHFEDREVLEQLFAAYIELIKEKHVERSRLSLARSVEGHPGMRTTKWELFDFTGTGPSFPLPGPAVLELPTLQDRFRGADIQEWQETTHYVLEQQSDATTRLRFLPGHLPNRRVYAPTVRRIDPSVVANFAVPLLKETLALSDILDTREQRDILQAVWHMYQQGPTYYNTRVCANAAAHLPFAKFAGRITRQDGREIDLRFGYSFHAHRGDKGNRIYAGTSLGVSVLNYTDTTGYYLWYDERALNAPTLSSDDVLLIATQDAETDSSVREVLNTASVDPALVTGTGTLKGKEFRRSPGTFHLVRKNDLCKLTFSDTETLYLRIQNVFHAPTKAIQDTDGSHTLTLAVGQTLEGLAPENVIGIQSTAHANVLTRTIVSTDSVRKINLDDAVPLGYLRSNDAKIHYGDEYLTLDAPPIVPTTHPRENLHFQVVRRALVRLQSPVSINKTNLSWTAFRPQENWPSNLWRGCHLIDQVGQSFLVSQSQKSSLFLAGVPESPRGWPSNGPVTLRNPLQDAGEDRQHETLRADLLPIVRAEQWVRRFEPLSDGLRLLDWKSQEGTFTDPKMHYLTQPAAAQSTTLVLDSTENIAIGDVFFLSGDGHAPVIVHVTQVEDSTNTITLRTPLEHGYTLAGLARIFPAQISAQGLGGHSGLTTFRTDGRIIDGRTFESASGGFDTSNLVQGDLLRLVNDGVVQTYQILQVHNATQLQLFAEEDLGAPATGRHFHIVRAHNPADYNVFEVSASVVTLSQILLDRIRQLVTGMKTGWTAQRQYPVTTESPEQPITITDEWVDWENLEDFYYTVLESDNTIEIDTVFPELPTYGTAAVAGVNLKAATPSATQIFSKRGWS